MAMKINTTNKVTKVYKSKAVENLEDSYLIKKLKQKYGKDFPLSQSMIDAEKMAIMMYRIMKGKTTKDIGLEYIKEMKYLFNKILKDEKKQEIEINKKLKKLRK